MSSYYNDGVLVGQFIFGLFGLLVLIGMAMGGQPIAIIFLILLLIDLWSKLTYGD